LKFGEGLERDRETEFVETADIAAGSALGVASVEVVLAEFAIGGVCENM
jgi:hypothetical protein